MAQTSPKGWLMLLSDSAESNWGGTEEFYESVTAESENRDVFEMESEVWGKLNRSGLRPQIGDGIAFYHTSRARFPRGDPHRRRPRVSLLAEITGVEQDGQNICYLKAKIRRVDLDHIRRSPIVRDDDTKHLFEQCGMVPGSVATFYEVSPAVWSELLRRGTQAVEAPSKSHIPGTAASPGASRDVDAQDLAAIEGIAREVISYYKSRSRPLRDAALALGKGVCEACGTDFTLILDGQGVRVLQVHHRQQLSVGDEPRLTSVTDLAVVCANCHSLIHMDPKRALSIETLRGILHPDG